MTTWIAPWERADGAARARATFTAAFGYEPSGVWAAPGRVNIIGEHVDYNGGVCLPIALPHRTYLAFAPRPDPADRSVRLVSDREAATWAGSLDEVAPGLGSWAAYVVGVPWALEQAGHATTGFDAAVSSCVPYGAGLSSSAALECAAAVALADADSWDGPDPATTAGRSVLAAACVRAENEIAGANTGGMDQNASLHCRADHALHFDTRSGELSQVPFDVSGHGLELLVIDTKAPHALVDGQYAARRATCEAAAAELGVATLRDVDDLGAALARLRDPVSRARVRHVVTEIERVEEFSAAFRADDLARAGELMTASHVSLRDDYEVSAPELDVAVDSALGAGALGARMTGGGFGGSAIALVPAGSPAVVVAAVEAAFDRSGFAAPEFLLAPAAEGAGRVA
ncbi:galactokinase [Pseudactinotalea sp. HY160]|uniref:galactokinase n=1 Tax=Pseudactinotalea sp. HY160 TaxID=2654490 RepID=UPI00128B7EFB|nr:galactokinase [Pseudactinotalea sp. HY160]MPV51127.1 galactokinase [Pseudactinotalea sp. HY160]